VAIFVLGLLSPALIPVVTSAGLPGGITALLTGALAFGIPEVMMVVAAGVMGKAGFAAMKARIGVFLRRHGPAETVGRTRYRIGLGMFALPLLVGFAGPYLGDHLPGFETRPMWWHVGGDLMFASSLFVLGGAFWDKLRALFTHGARAVFPAEGAPDDQ
jgi:hypothetical protein